MFAQEQVPVGLIVEMMLPGRIVVPHGKDIGLNLFREIAVPKRLVDKFRYHR